MLLVLAFVLLAGAVYYAAAVVWAPERERRLSLRRIGVYSGRPASEAPWLGGRAFERYAPGLAHLAQRVDPRSTPARVGVRLVAAGMARTVTPTAFLASKVVAAAVGFGLGGLLVASSGHYGRAFVVAVALGVVGFILPDAYLALRIRSRREEMRVALPDTLDVLAVSVEAGLGLEAAIARVGEHMRGPLVDELNLVLNELRVGESRSKALHKLGERAGFPEMETFVQAILQGEQLGAPLGRVLRVQAADSRTRRQLAAEEKAMKAPVKMLMPTALFIFPAMFVVILGPALIKILETF